jgi:hypothetical protein
MTYGYRKKIVWYELEYTTRQNKLTQPLKVYNTFHFGALCVAAQIPI